MLLHNALAYIIAIARPLPKYIYSTGHQNSKRIYQITTVMYCHVLWCNQGWAWIGMCMPVQLILCPYVLNVWYALQTRTNIL